MRKTEPASSTHLSELEATSREPGSLSSSPSSQRRRSSSSSTVLRGRSSTTPNLELAHKQSSPGNKRDASQGSHNEQTRPASSSSSVSTERANGRHGDLDVTVPDRVPDATDSAEAVAAESCAAERISSSCAKLRMVKRRTTASRSLRRAELAHAIASDTSATEHLSHFTSEKTLLRLLTSMILSALPTSAMNKPAASSVFYISQISYNG